MAKLEVEIGAKVDGLKKGLDKAEKALSDFKNETDALADAEKKAEIATEKLDNSVEDLNKDYRQGAKDVKTYSDNLKSVQASQNTLGSNTSNLAGNLGKTSKEIDRLGNRSMPNLANSTANAVPAVTEFSRVIQDAPFGIQGVANNITQLTQQFGNLSTKLGGSRAALKAMLSTLSGPAGILLAISTVTSLLVAFGGSLFGASKNSDKLKDSTKDTNEELKSQSSILKELIDEYEDFAKIRTRSIFNITKEKESVKALFSVLRDDLSTTEERARAYDALNKSYSDYLKNVDPRNINQVIKAEQALAKQLEVREKRVQTLNRLEEVARDIQLKRIEIENLGNVPTNDKRLTGLGTEILKLRELQSELRQALALYTALDTSIGSLSPGQRGQATTLGLQRVGINANGGEAAAGGQEAEPPILEKAKENAKKLKNFLLITADEINNIIDNNFANAFSKIGEALGSALSGATNFGDSLAKILLSTIGNILVQLGKMAIAIGTTLETVKKSLLFGKGALAIGVGIAAVALGSIFKSGAARLGGGGFTSGVGGATSGGFGGSRGFTGGGQITGNVTFTIQGTDLVGVLNNTLDQNNIFGGNIIVGSD